jgi:zinc finger protein 830
MPPKPDVRSLFNKSRTERKATKQIQHPLAKYDTQGRLTCVICAMPVKSEVVWPSHLSSASHKQTLAKLRQLKETPQTKDGGNKVQARTTSQRDSLVGYGDGSDGSDEDSDDEPTTQPAKRQRVEKDEQGDEQESDDNMDTDEKPMSALPEGFFDAPSKAEEEKDQEQPTTESDSKLPAGFFDDPEADAKARNAPAPAEQLEADLDHEYELFKNAVAEDEQQAAIHEEIDEEELWRDRDEDLARQQEELVARVDDLKRNRLEGKRAPLPVSAPKTTQFGEDDTSSRELKSSVRDQLKLAYQKKAAARRQPVDFMDEDEEDSDSEDEDDWRAQQL